MNTENALLATIPTSVTLRNIRAGKYTIRYAEAGRGNPLILLHGVNIGWGQWYPNIAPFSKYAKIIAPDLPGCGQSSALDFTSLDFIDDLVVPLEQFIAKLHLKRITVLGHSFSGALALSLAFRGNLDIKKLILVNPLGFSHYVPPKQRGLSFYPLAWFLVHVAVKPTKKNMNMFLIDVMHNKKYITEAFLNYYYDNVMHTKNHPFTMFHRFMRAGKIKPDLVFTNQLARLSTSTLIMYGKDDSMMHTSTKIAFQEIPNACIMPFENIGHVPNIEVPEQFNKRIIEFIRHTA